MTSHGVDVGRTRAPEMALVRGHRPRESDNRPRKTLGFTTPSKVHTPCCCTHQLNQLPFVAHGPGRPSWRADDAVGTSRNLGPKSSSHPRRRHTQVGQARYGETSSARPASAHHQTPKLQFTGLKQPGYIETLTDPPSVAINDRPELDRFHERLHPRSTLGQRSGHTDCQPRPGNHPSSNQSDV